MVYDPEHQQDFPLLLLQPRVDLYGGHGRPGTWADAAPVPKKVETARPVLQPGLIYDAGRQKVVVFGGQTPGAGCGS